MRRRQRNAKRSVDIQPLDGSQMHLQHFIKRMQFIGGKRMRCRFDFWPKVTSTEVDFTEDAGFKILCSPKFTPTVLTLFFLPFELKSFYENP